MPECHHKDTQGIAAVDEEVITGAGRCERELCVPYPG